MCISKLNILEHELEDLLPLFLPPPVSLFLVLCPSDIGCFGRLIVSGARTHIEAADGVIYATISRGISLNSDLS